MTLGFAIRMGQGLGLHIEYALPAQPILDEVSRETCRRTWHSAYILDRLLSLQLGRPSAIRDRDCNVQMPSRLGDEHFDIQQRVIPCPPDNGPQGGDYFVAVIRFSNIVGHVLRDLYTQHTADYSQDMFGRTASLDRELLNWRSGLPRALRFDRGHTLESSPLFKRQRNMLAIKYHHLRALIHRRYLRLPWLIRDDSKIAQLLESSSQQVVQLESICVHEAQETAHILHNVVDRKSLVEDFPWWQMVSCLICASSILLVMRAFSPTVTTTEVERSELLQEDAATCLLVLDSLSSHSDAARAAGDMLRRLGNLQVQDFSLVTRPPVQHHDNEATDQATWNGLSSLDSTMTNRSRNDAYDSRSADGTLDNPDLNSNDLIWDWQDWPSELANTMAWSSKFLDGV